MPARGLGHLSESHQMFERVTTLEANVSTLADSMNRLATSMQSIENTVGETRALIASVGKTDGKTILTLGASVVGALAVIGSMFLGPIQRDVQYLSAKITADEARVERAALRHEDFGRTDAQIDGKMELIEWRLKVLEEKKP